MRQLRVQPSEELIKKGVCTFPSYGNMMNSVGGSLNAGYEDLCHPIYGNFGIVNGIDVKNTRPYGNLLKDGSHHEYEHLDADKTNGSIVMSQDLFLPRDVSNYGGDGYVMFLPLNKTKARMMLDEIEGIRICEECLEEINGTKFIS